jgi:type 1 fimbriae regulatory protein FimB/type 1 fimbriae regulatory protein FimE
MLLHGKDETRTMSTVLAFKRTKPASPVIENGKVNPPRRVANRDRRSREHLTPAEVERLIAAAGKIGRHGARDATLILLAYRHGLRVSELIDLRWEQVDLERGTLHVNRKKSGDPATHPLSGRELRALRQLKRAYPASPFLFVTERGGPITAPTVRKMIARAGEEAHLGLPVHPHMLRHATGFYLANNGVDTRTIQAYLGHRNIMHTVRYTQLAPDRFRSLWRD